MKWQISIMAAASLLLACFVMLGQKIRENRDLLQQVEALTAPSAEAKTECVRMHVVAFRLMEARQNGMPKGTEAHNYAWARMSGGAPITQRYQRFFDNLETEVWSYSRQIGEGEQKRAADTYAELVEARCLERYSPRIVHPKI
ncbi:hypothetical protein AB9K35_04250 [Leisingera sp. XS_AS12]|uniref:hypothetical protein n=1 Tax=Leisingera sp. XS_AS12 TaxID=3241294 RepID=UPI0035142B1B